MDLVTLGKSEKYRYVFRVKSSMSSKEWVAKVGGKAKFAMTEHEAAKEADLLLILAGREPVNVLKPKH